MQEVIGAVFGWVNILAGRIYTVGDRVEVGGVRGDVMDITPLRTKIMEMGSEGATDERPAGSWVAARQPTGRTVTVSNKKTFHRPGGQLLGALRLDLGGAETGGSLRRGLACG
jgi:small-conductance mechanosensitive channel